MAPPPQLHYNGHYTEPYTSSQGKVHYFWNALQNYYNVNKSWRRGDLEARIVFGGSYVIVVFIANLDSQKKLPLESVFWTRGENT